MDKPIVRSYPVLCVERRETKGAEIGWALHREMLDSCSLFSRQSFQKSFHMIITDIGLKDVLKPALLP